MFNEVNYDGLSGDRVTMKLASAVVTGDEGKVVAISGQDTVAIPVADRAIGGRLIKVEDGFGTVQFRGCMTVPCNDAALTRGDNVRVCSDGSGGIRGTSNTDPAQHTLVTVLHLDTVAHTATILR